MSRKVSVLQIHLVAGLALVLTTGACGHSHEGEELLGEVVLQDDASDEAFAALADTFDQGGATAGAQASEWTAPAAGALPAATPPTFEWTDGATARHGTATGRFVWLHLEAAGDPEAIDVASIDTTTFTPTATQWARLSAGGSITARLITAQLDDARVVLGPFQPAAPTRTFTIGE